MGWQRVKRSIIDWLFRRSDTDRLTRVQKEVNEAARKLGQIIHDSGLADERFRMAFEEYDKALRDYYHRKRKMGDRV